MAIKSAQDTRFGASLASIQASNNLSNN